MHEPGSGLSPLAGATSTLEAAGIAYALIGAGALAVHGISRSTFDLDLLAVDRGCLVPGLWALAPHSGGRRPLSPRACRGSCARWPDWRESTDDDVSRLEVPARAGAA
jgi:hypothetical protein